MPTTMRKFLKPAVSAAPKKKGGVSKSFWVQLRMSALARAAANEFPKNDPRVHLLQNSETFPEQALRRLSILTLNDITREFGPEPS